MPSLCNSCLEISARSCLKSIDLFYQYAQRAGRRVDGIDFFCRDDDLSGGGELRGGEEEIEVGHVNHLTLFQIKDFLNL